MKRVRVSYVALLVGTIAAAVSCADPAPTGVAAGGPRLQSSVEAPANGPASQGGWRQSGLLYCSPHRYDSVTTTIGPHGGEVRVGLHKLSIPPGALGAPVSITAVAPSDTVDRVRFRPEGLTFARPASLRMKYDNCSWRGAKQPQRIAYTDDLLKILEYVQSRPDKHHRYIVGRIEHFSNYSVAW